MSSTPPDNDEEDFERFCRDTLKSWRDYRDSGLHVTAEDADSWMAALEAGQDIEPPTPRV